MNNNKRDIKHTDNNGESNDRIEEGSEEDLRSQWSLLIILSFLLLKWNVDWRELVKWLWVLEALTANTINTIT